LFSDECLFQLNENNQKVFKLKGEKMPIQKKFYPNVKVMVWGGISFEEKTLLSIIKNTLKADRYLKVLKERRRDIMPLFRNRGILSRTVLLVIVLLTEKNISNAGLQSTLFLIQLNSQI